MRRLLGALMLAASIVGLHVACVGLSILSTAPGPVWARLYVAVAMAVALFGAVVLMLDGLARLGWRR